VGSILPPREPPTDPSSRNETRCRTRRRRRREKTYDCHCVRAVDENVPQQELAGRMHTGTLKAV